jgi:hypothetical protein
MKKYLLGLFVLVLAVGFSAFNNAKKSTKATDAAYYWYSINGTVLGSRLGDVGGVPTTYTQTAAMNAGLTDCEDNGSVLCIAGHTQSNQTGQAIPSETFDGDNYIEKP